MTHQFTSITSIYTLVNFATKAWSTASTTISAAITNPSLNAHHYLLFFPWKGVAFSNRGANC